jgi:hypothetical protein
MPGHTFQRAAVVVRCALSLLLALGASGAAASPRLSVAAGPSLLLGDPLPAGQLRLQVLTGGARPGHFGLEGGLVLSPNKAVEERCLTPDCSSLEVVDRATDALWHLGLALRVEGTQRWLPYFSAQCGLASSNRYGGQRSEGVLTGASLSLGGGVRPWSLGPRLRLGIEARAQGYLLYNESFGTLGALASVALLLDFE